jgi:hypothetical protein
MKVVMNNTKQKQNILLTERTNELLRRQKHHMCVEKTQRPITQHCVCSSYDMTHSKCTHYGRSHRVSQRKTFAQWIPKATSLTLFHIHILLFLKSMCINPHDEMAAQEICRNLLWITSD